MTKKHFELFAEHIRIERAAALRMSDGLDKEKEIYAIDRTQALVADVCKQINFAFDKERFSKACQPVKK